MDASTTSEGAILRFDEVGAKRSVILEDDGRVAYAYLLEDEQIVADVWLYNVVATPEEPEWPNPSKMPFLNPRRFCRMDESLPRIGDGAAQCNWNEKGVEVMLNGLVVARLAKGSRPGWSRLALKRGPLAHPLGGEP